MTESNIMHIPLEKLILMGDKGVHYNSYIKLDVDKYFTLADMLKFTKVIETLNAFESIYAVSIINIVLDGDEDA